MTIETAVAVNAPGLESSAAPFTCRTFSPPDIAVDLGTANLRVCSTDSDIVEVPSSVGEAAARRYPLRGGVIVDPEAATELLHHALLPVRTWHARPPRVLATLPGDASEDEREALVTALYAAGAGVVVMVQESVAAGVGADLVSDAKAVRMIVDVGEGVTDAAVLSGGFVLHRASIRLACADMRECIQDGASRSGITLTREEANAILRAEDGADCRGFSAELRRHATASVIETIAVFVRSVYADLDSALRRRIAREGVCVAGGGALFRAVRTTFVRQLELPIHVVADPMRAVISGSQRLINGECAHVWGGFED